LFVLKVDVKTTREGERKKERNDAKR